MHLRVWFSPSDGFRRTPRWRRSLRPLTGPDSSSALRVVAYQFIPSWPDGYGATAEPWGWFIGAEVRWRLNANLGIGGTVTYATARLVTHFRPTGSGTPSPSFWLRSRCRGVSYPTQPCALGSASAWGLAPSGGYKREITPRTTATLNLSTSASAGAWTSRTAGWHWVFGCGFGLGMTTSSIEITRPAMSLQIGVRLLFDVTSQGPLL